MEDSNAWVEGFFFFNFEIIGNLLFLDFVPRTPSYGVYFRSLFGFYKDHMIANNERWFLLHHMNTENFERFSL